MEKQVFNFSIEHLYEEITKWISSNGDWIYYFINPLKRDEDYFIIEECLKKHIDDWSLYISFVIRSIDRSGIDLDICVYDVHGNRKVLNGYLFFNNFESVVKKHKMLFEDKIKDDTIVLLRKEVEDLRNRLEESEKKLEVLCNK